jgi:hypothetical protein
MRAAKTVIVIWLLCELALWIRDGRGFCVLEALPFVERQEYFSRDYEWFALAALMIGLWGYLMLPRKTGDQQQQQDPTQFRSSIVLVPLTIIGLALLSRRLTPAVSFGETVGHSGKLLEHTYLAALGVLVVGALLAIKRFRNR